MPVAAPSVITHLPQASLLPLHALLDDVALVESCDGATPLPASSHRVADAGAALVLAVSMVHDRFAETIARRCLAFIESMHLGHGVFRPNDTVADERAADERAADDTVADERAADERADDDTVADDTVADDTVADERAADESTGWAIEGVGTATDAPWPDVRERARRLFPAVVDVEMDGPRGRAHAVLGAVAAATAAAPVSGAGEMAARLVAGLGSPVDPHDDGRWPWPEPRLHPGSGAIAEARVAAADAFGDADDLAAALTTLRWFADLETAPGHLSPAPTGGRGPADAGPGFDQRPIAAAALAAAAGRALALTGDRTWERPVLLAAGWFAGSNDVGVTLFDRDTGRAFDALERDGAGRCQGAEAAIAFATVLRELQRLRRVAPRPSPGGRR